MHWAYLEPEPRLISGFRLRLFSEPTQNDSRPAFNEAPSRTRRKNIHVSADSSLIKLDAGGRWSMSFRGKIAADHSYCFASIPACPSKTIAAARLLSFIESAAAVAAAAAIGRAGGRFLTISTRPFARGQWNFTHFVPSQSAGNRLSNQ